VALAGLERAVRAVHEECHLGKARTVSGA
jgi:hypothetical protein